MKWEKRSPRKVWGWKYYMLISAGVYNLLWGSFAIFFPREIFLWSGMAPPRYIEFWQCIGMIVGVYGVGYMISASHPKKYWPIIFVGLLGKVFGPIGFLQALVTETLPLKFGINIIFNDLIWWVPFTLILLPILRDRSLEGITVKEEEFTNFSERKRARFVNCLSGFKSGNLIGTINGSGQTNLSIVNSAFHLGSNPALIGFIVRPDVVPRDTLTNIRENGIYTLNHVNTDIIQKAHQCSARYETSEFKECGLTEEYLDQFKAPFVRESRLKMSLEFLREMKIEENGTHLLIGKVKNVYLPKQALKVDGFVDLEEAKTICISGIDSYHGTDKIGRLSYAKPQKSPQWF